MLGREIKVGLVLLGMSALWPLAANAQSFNGQVDATIEFGAAYVFQTTFDESGMSGVSGEVQSCYMKVLAGTITPMRAQICMLLDLTAVSTDEWFRKRLSGASGRMPPPTTPILSDDAFNARINTYVNKYFQGNTNAFNSFYPSDSVVVVLRDATALDAQ